MKPCYLLTLFLVVSCSMQSTAPTAIPQQQEPPPSRTTVGNGSDDDPEKISAWFLGPRPVHYCYEVADNFGMTRAEIEPILRTVLDDWERYLSDKHLNDPRFHPERDIEPGDPGLYFHHQFDETCTARTDLTFYFGVETKQAKAAAARYKHPIGLAERLTYDLQDGWGNGFVWLPSAGSYESGFPRWNTHPHFALIGTLMHEVGHVLGCGHVKYSWMEDDLADHIHSFDTWGAGPAFDDRSMLSGIDSDWERELLLCERCAVPELVGTFENEGELWNRIVGESRVWGWHGGVFLEPTAAFANQFTFGNLPGLSGSLEVRNLHLIGSENFDTPIFKLNFRRANGVWPLVRSFSKVVSYSATVDTAHGPAPVLLIRNSSGGRFILRPFPGDGTNSEVRLDVRSSE